MALQARDCRHTRLASHRDGAITTMTPKRLYVPTTSIVVRNGSSSTLCTSPIHVDSSSFPPPLIQAPPAPSWFGQASLETLPCGQAPLSIPLCEVLLDSPLHEYYYVPLFSNI